MRQGFLIARTRTRARSLPITVRPDLTIRTNTAFTVPTVPTVMVRLDRTIRSDTAFIVMVRSGRTMTMNVWRNSPAETAAAAITTEYTP
jgi:hypothetical protein